MTVSTSKLTFSLIAITALFISGSAMLNQDAFGLAAPEFTATHLNTTATKITFDQNVNGTLYKLDWTIKALSCAAPCTTNTAATAGDSLTDFTINDILNGTASGLVLNSDGTPEANGDASYNGLQVHTGQPGQGHINHTAVGDQIPTVIILIHDAIPSDATYFVNFTGNAASAPETTSNAILANAQGITGAGATAAENAAVKFLKVGTNATATDGMSPSVVSAKKIGPKKIEVLMSEPVGNINSTGIDFTLYGSHDSVVSSLIATNVTNILYITTQNLINPISDTPALTLSYTTYDTANGVLSNWITDAINSDRYVQNAGADGGAMAGHGNRLLNFTGLSVFYPTDFVSDTQRYPPHIHDEVSISLNSDIVYDLKIQDNTTLDILAHVGDTISITVSIGDDDYLNRISKSILITNYADRPSDMNEYYSTNQDQMGQTGLSVYEWNQNTFDQNYDYAGVISWDDVIIKIDKRIETYHEFVGPLLISENELFITYSLTFDNVMPKSPVGIKISDTNYNNFESFLPFTLEVLPNDAVVIVESAVEPTEESAVESAVESAEDYFSLESNLAEITLVTNDDSYENGDKVIVTGQIENYDFNSMKGKDILYSIISPENVVLSSGHVGPNSDGSFYFTTFAMDNLWKTDGNYIFSVNLSSLKQTIDIFYDNSEFESFIIESEPKTTTITPVMPEATTITPVMPEATTITPVMPEATTITPVMPEATTITPVMPEATTITPVMPEATTITPVMPEATTSLSNSNILCGTGTEDVNGICQVIQTEEKPSRGGGCLIATAAYGSEMSSQVQLLREIRDNQLMNTESGSAFMSGFNELYYSFSPTIADMQRDSPILKEIVKVGLTPMLSSLAIMENADSESEVLGLGLSVIALNLGMYLAVPAAVIIGIRKKF